MAAAMSHEVRTPLGILRSSADLLKREKKLSQEGQEVLGFISSETERLNKLVSTLIDAARPRQPNFTEINITALISNVIKLLQNQAGAKKIALAFDASQIVEMRADADQMTQVMMNLIMNAIQLLPEHGKIEVTMQAGEDAVRVIVADNGEGIAAKHQAQIFEPFFTQRAGGVGLGLAIVRQIVQAHGGEIHYETSHMGGAQFTMTFAKN
jgi:two-component system sensor histidine kinase HydH